MLLLSMILIYVIVHTAVYNYTSSDPRLTLLTSQSIIEKHTINLESYRVTVPSSEFSGGWQSITNEKTHETFLRYPLGTPLLSIPFVFIATKAFGMNMMNHEDDTKLQLFIASLLCILIFYLLYSLGCSFLSKQISLILTLTIFLGTTLINTLGSALWSFDFEIIFILFALREIINSEKGNKPKMVLIAIYLTMAWVCRPSALSLIAVVGLWMLIKHSKFIWKYILGSALILIPFFIFAYCSEGRVIPVYYDPFYWKKEFLGIYYFTVLKWLLFSPMRGLFVFTPALIIAFIGFLKSSLRKNTLYKLLFFHFIIQTLMLISQMDWFGGWCYGPRLYSDIIPSLIIMIFIVIKEYQPLSRLKIVFISVLLSAGIFIHTIQAMYNLEVHSWNNNPDISTGLFFDAWNWRFPQFLATKESNKLKGQVYNLEHEIDLIRTKTPNGSTILYGQPNADMAIYLKQWNEKNWGSWNDIHNSIDEIKALKEKEFWFPVSLINEVRKDSSFSIVYPSKEDANQEILKAIIKE